MDIPNKMNHHNGEELLTLEEANKILESFCYSKTYEPGEMNNNYQVNSIFLSPNHDYMDKYEKNDFQYQKSEDYFKVNKLLDESRKIRESLGLKSSFLTKETHLEGNINQNNFHNQNPLILHTPSIDGNILETRDDLMNTQNHFFSDNVNKINNEFAVENLKRHHQAEINENKYLEDSLNFEINNLEKDILSWENKHKDLEREIEEKRMKNLEKAQLKAEFEGAISQLNLEVSAYKQRIYNREREIQELRIRLTNEQRIIIDNEVGEKTLKSLAEKETLFKMNKKISESLINQDNKLMNYQKSIQGNKEMQMKFLNNQSKIDQNKEEIYQKELEIQKLEMENKNKKNSLQQGPKIELHEAERILQLKYENEHLKKVVEQEFAEISFVKNKLQKIELEANLLVSENGNLREKATVDKKSNVWCF